MTHAKQRRQWPILTKEVWELSNGEKYYRKHLPLKKPMNKITKNGKKSVFRAKQSCLL